MGAQFEHRLFAREFCDSGLFVRFQIPQSSTIIHFRFPEYHASAHPTKRQTLLINHAILVTEMPIVSVVFADTREQA